MTVIPCIKFNQKLSAQGSDFHRHLVFYNHLDRFFHDIIKTLYRHNRVTFWRPCNLFIHRHSAKWDDINFKVQFSVISFIEELLRVFMTLEMILLQCMAYLIKGAPILYGYSHIKILSPSFRLIRRHQFQGNIPSPGTHNI